MNARERPHAIVGHIEPAGDVLFAEQAIAKYRFELGRHPRASFSATNNDDPSHGVEFNTFVVDR
jgi:hypothetical protein